MRTASDVLTNPKPGDVVRCGPGWTRTVLSNDGDHVRYMVTYDGKKNVGPCAVSTARWGASLQESNGALAAVGFAVNDMATVEVLHVAE
jgi:hypothetical protein